MVCGVPPLGDREVEQPNFQRGWALPSGLKQSARNQRRGGSLPLMGIKLLHTVIWAVMASAILLLPFTALADRLDLAAGITLLILAECAVLALNKGRCPLTDWAAPYTDNRAANFDIYLPEWLARRNKTIFGAMFLAGEIVVLWRLFK